MSQYKILYEELPEEMFRGMKILEDTRRELTSIVLVAKEFGFDSCQDMGSHSLIDFIETRLRDAELEKQANSINITGLERAVLSVTYAPSNDVIGTIDKAIELLKILKRIRDDFGDDISRAFGEEVY